MKKTPLIYSPYLDWIILTELQKYAKKFDSKAVFDFISKTELQKKISQFSSEKYQNVPRNAGPFLADSIVGDSTAKTLFEDFKKRNNFSLEIPIPPPQQGRNIFLTSAALMSLATEWPLVHKADKINYVIKKEFSITRNEFTVAGFILSKVTIGRYEEEAITALIDLGNGFSIELCDTNAFKNSDQLTDNNDFNALLSLQQLETHYYHKPGILYCPCVSEECHKKDHLAGMTLKNRHAGDSVNSVQEIVIDSSESLGKLELSEWGVKAKAETVARSRMLLGARINNEYTPILTIKNGLVVKICHNKELLFIAYISQESFKRA